MTIPEALQQYKELKNFFAFDYERDNEILLAFKKKYPTLSAEQTDELIKILECSKDINEQYFVADLLYLYSTFGDTLMKAMLKTGIMHTDPSFNRIFLKPCVRAYGHKRVAEFLNQEFINGDIVTRIGILNLLYWFRPLNKDVKALRDQILRLSKNTNNLIELYYYKLMFGSKIQKSWLIPNDALGLTYAIWGNKEYEDLLYNKIGWVRDNRHFIVAPLIVPKEVLLKLALVYKYAFTSKTHN